MFTNMSILGTPRQRAIVSCIAFNLLLGNSIILFMKPSYGSINYPLMLGTSVSCVLCYIVLFRVLRPDLGKIALALISIATSMAIIFIGAAVTMLLFSGDEFNCKSLSDWLALPFMLLLSSVMGSIIMFPFSVAFGLINIFWLVKINRIPMSKI